MQGERTRFDSGSGEHTFFFKPLTSRRNQEGAAAFYFLEN